MCLERQSDNYFRLLSWKSLLVFAISGCGPSPGDVHPKDYGTRNVMIEIRYIASGFPDTQGLEGVGALLRIDSVGELVEVARSTKLDSVAWLEAEHPPDYSVERDAWGNQFDWDITGTAQNATVRITSPGRDGIVGGANSDDITMFIYYVDGRETSMELFGVPD